MSIFEHTYGTSEGHACVVTDDFKSARWFSWPEDREFMEKYVEIRSDEDVYFTTTLYNEEERVTAHASVGWAVYADADTCHPSNFRLPPTIANETSPGKWHCFWVLDEEASAATLSELSQLIATAHKDQGCDAGWITTKLLRVPGTSNTKYTKGFTVREVNLPDSGIVYTEDTIRDAYADIKPVDKANYIDATMPIEMPSIFKTVDKMPEDLWDLYADVPAEGQDWSERLWKLELELFRAGLSREEVFVIAKNAKCNKYARDHRPDSALWTEVLRASVQFTDDVIVEITPEDRQQTITPVFVTPEERAFVKANPGFIEDYVAWVHTRSPEAAETYSRTLGYILLSCVYGGRGFIIPQFGPMKLNLWALILGESTKTRKSTARALMLHILHSLERQTEDKVDIGSDFTAEGLNVTLAERDGMVSLAHRDEVQGFLHAMEAKSYLAGTKQALTELYDGKVAVTMRATKGASQKGRAETVFNFLGLGIQKEMAQLMTEKDFRSGFLHRFVWAIAETPKWTPESEVVRQMNNENELTGEDATVTQFIHVFMRNLAFFTREGDKPWPIVMTDEVWERWMKWKLDSAKMIRGLDNESLFDSSRDRMSYSIWKAAALLAMHDRSKMIEMRHLLPVLVQAESWFNDMMLMANAVASSQFQAKAEAIEEFIIAGTNHVKSRAQLYRKFGRKAEVDEYLDNLKAQGRIKTIQETQSVQALVVD